MSPRRLDTNRYALLACLLFGAVGCGREAGWRPGVVLRDHGSAVWSVALSPDGRTTATGGYDATVQLWDAETGHRRATLTHLRHFPPILAR